MAWQKATIVNCKSASIRQKPWIPMLSEEIVGIRDGPKELDDDTIQVGKSIEIDPEVIQYSWTGRKYYKTRSPSGWVYEGVVDYGGD